jgi:hypothetical protein
MNIGTIKQDQKWSLFYMAIAKTERDKDIDEQEEILFLNNILLIIPAGY